MSRIQKQINPPTGEELEKLERELFQMHQALLEWDILLEAVRECKDPEKRHALVKMMKDLSGKIQPQGDWDK